jgi:hypothetical protein
MLRRRSVATGTKHNFHSSMDSAIDLCGLVVFYLPHANNLPKLFNDETEATR